MTKKKKILSKYYLLIFPPFIIALVILALCEVLLWDRVLFALGFSWQVVLRAPFIEDKVWKKSYKYSFVRFIYLSDQYILKLAGQNPKKIKLIFLRMFSPFFFGATLVILIGYGSLIYLLSGILLSELILFKRFKFNPN